MRHLRLLSILILLPFTMLTGYALYEVGYLGFFTYQGATSNGIQVFSDLSIALMFFTIWMVPHARRTRRNPWVYALITLAAGSFGPLLYFALWKPEQDVAQETHP